MKKTNLLIIFILCIFSCCLNVNALTSSGTGCSKQQLNNLIKETSINEKDKFCVYKNNGYDEYYPIIFKYSSENDNYKVSNFKTCNNGTFLSDDINKFTSCGNYVVYFNYADINSGFVLKNKNECNPDVEICFQYDNSINVNPKKTVGSSCKLKNTDIEILDLSTDGEYYLFKTNKGNLCPARTDDKGITFQRIDVNDSYIKIDFDCTKLQSEWKVVENKDSYTYETCKYHLVTIDTEISSSFDTHNIEETGDLVATYKKYRGSAQDSIRILKKSDNSYKAVNSSGGEFNGISSDLIKNSFDGNTTYPKYILNKNGSYSFIDSIKDENGNVIEYDEVYIRSGSSEVNGTGLSDEETYQTCRELFGDSFLTLLNDYVFKIIWIGVPLLLILLTTFDFAKVVFVDDKEGIQNAFRRLIKRAIASVLIFLTPYIIILIAHYTGAGDSVQDCVKTVREMGSTAYIINNLTK